MSKSAGNVVLVSHVVERGFDPLALRLALMQNRYRQQMNLTWDAIAAAQSTLARWRSRVAEWATQPSSAMPPAVVDPMLAAMSDDLDVPRAVLLLRELEKDSGIVDGAKFEVFAYMDRVLGLDLVRDVGRAAPITSIPDSVQSLLDARATARAAKDWSASDALRDEIADLGWSVTDTAEGQQARPL